LVGLAQVSPAGSTLIVLLSPPDVFAGWFGSFHGRIPEFVRQSWTSFVVRSRFSPPVEASWMPRSGLGRCTPGTNAVLSKFVPLAAWMAESTTEVSSEVFTMLALVGGDSDGSRVSVRCLVAACRSSVEERDLGRCGRGTRIPRLRLHRAVWKAWCSWLESLAAGVEDTTIQTRCMWVSRVNLEEGQLSTDAAHGHESSLLDR
jgi:hypothetical protein